MEKKKINVNAISDQKINSENFCKFTAKLIDQLHKIPEEYRENSIIEFESEYDSCNIIYNINYVREENDEEYAWRISEPERRAAEEIKRKETEKYNQLVQLKKLINLYPNEAADMVKNHD